MNNNLKLMKYAIEYLSKYSSTKRNLEIILKKKIMRMQIEKKDRYILYQYIPEIILKLEKNKLIDDQNYALSKMRLFVSQGKSKLYVKNYFLQKGIDKIILLESIEKYEQENPNWEYDAGKNFIRKKKLINSLEYEKNLARMARAGFNYALCQSLLEKN